MPSLPDMTTPNVAELARDAAAHAAHPEAPAPDVGQAAFLEFLLRTGDNTLILGHRASEWCGHGPALEEDIALANTALDLIGPEVDFIIHNHMGWQALPIPSGGIYDWDPRSTYIAKPPYFEGFGFEPAPVTDLVGGRAMVVVGDSVKTDHI